MKAGNFKALPRRRWSLDGWSGKPIKKISKLPSFDGLGRNVFVLGAVSFFNDISSEMLYPVVPLFLTAVLHAPMGVVGLIEGSAECAANLLKVVSGRLSDRLGKRRPFVLTGYGFSSFAKLLLTAASSWGWVLSARLCDRTGKGIRTPSRDAMLVAASRPDRRGTAFGLHRAMDTAGAVLGPLAALFFFNVLGKSYRWLFAAAFVPSLFAFLILLRFCRREPAPLPRPLSQKAGKIPLPHPFKRFVFVYALFALGNSSDVFLLLKLKAMGFSFSAVLWAYAFFNVIFALASTPLGRLSDCKGRRPVLMGSFFLFALVYGGLALGPGKGAVWGLLALYGLWAAASEGVAKAYVSDLAPGDRKATALGVFQSVSGFSALAASGAAGLLWEHFGPDAAFALGAVCALGAGLLFPILCRGDSTLGKTA